MAGTLPLALCSATDLDVLMCGGLEGTAPVRLGSLSKLIVFSMIGKAELAT